MLNPNIDRSELARRFKEDDRILIRDFLKPEIAEQLRTLCLREVPFEFVYVVDDQRVVTPPGELQKWGAQETEKFRLKLFESASKGIGFFYCSYMLRRSKAHLDNPKLSLLHDVFVFMNSQEVLQLISEITGRTDLLSAESQFTRFTPGQFLTRHRDVAPKQERRLAYVLSLTKNWHPDWGGLLQFYQDDGTPRESWSPVFNSLTLFDIRHVHAVTYVAPYAGQPRLSLTGWFRAIPFNSSP